MKGVRALFVTYLAIIGLGLTYFAALALAGR